MSVAQDDTGTREREGTAVRDSLPAANMTDGLQLLVQLVTAAMTTDP